MKQKFWKSLIVVLGLFSFARFTVFAVGPAVTNVRAAQRAGTKLVDIYYDVADADSSVLTVGVAVSTNGGAAYFSPGASVSGAVGTSVAPGSNKKITWNAGVDLPAKLFSNARISVTASDNSGADWVVIDDFNRPDGDSVGNGWTEFGSTSRVQISGNAVLIDDYPSDAGNTGLKRPLTFNFNQAEFRYKKIPFGKSHVFQFNYNGLTFSYGGPYFPNGDPVVSDTWYVVFVDLNWGAAVARVYVDGVFKGTIPMDASRDPYLDINSIMMRSHGTADNTDVYYDYIKLRSNEASTGVSPTFAVDTRTGGIAVSGRVLDAVNRSAISGATVTLAGQNTSSSGAGLFSFASVSLSSGNTLAVSKSGYATYTGTVPAPAGATAVTVPDISLQTLTVGNTNKPIVTKLEPKLKGLFLDGVHLPNDFTASVNWNGTTPSTVRFFANDLLVAETNGLGPEYTVTIDMAGESFRPAFDATANKVRVNAMSAGSVSSEPLETYTPVIPVPDVLNLLLGNMVARPETEAHLAFSFALPEPPVKAVLDLPLIGKFGVEIALSAEFDYDLVSAEWDVFVGGDEKLRQRNNIKRPYFDLSGRKAHLYLGQTELTGKFGGGAKGILSLTQPFEIREGYILGEIGGKLEITRVGVLDLVGPGASQALRSLTLGQADAALRNFTIGIYALPSISGEILFDLSGLKGGELEGKLGIEAAYEPKLPWGGIEGRFYVGGEPSVTFGFPGDPIKHLRFRAYAGAEFKAWIFTVGPFEYVFVDVSYPAAKSFPLGMRAADGTTSVALFKVVTPDGDRVRPVSRKYLQAGPERFVAFDGATRMAGGLTTPASLLEAFRTVGRPSAKSTASKSDTPASQNGPVQEAGPKVGQADLPLVENVFPGSAPAMASKGQELMLLYVTDNGSPNNLQFTDIEWTRFDGTNWSMPATIQTNTQAEFSPQVAYDGNGDAIAVWERVADSNFNQTNLTAMAAQMEIVWSKWNHTNGTWSTPAPLTSNGYLDHAPLLCGPMTNGTVLVTWTANTSNLLMGTNGAASQVLWSRWSPASQSWSAAQTLLATLPYRLSQSLSGVSNLAVYAWSQDLDGVLTNENDQHVFYCTWSNGVWGAATQFTSATNGNRNARVSVGPDGHRYLVWQSGTNLMLSRDFSTNATLVRADSQTAGFADYATTIGPVGNLVLLWQEMSQAGSDAHYRVLDPVSATWSKDAQLFNDPPLERSFAPVWDDVGNLTAAYDKVQIIYTNKTVTLEGGGTATITNVPQPGRVDLYVTKRQLIKDVALSAGDFTVSAENYLPGAAVTVSATVRNVGDVGLSNVVVAFYDGNPTNSGVLITNVTIPGWLEGAATNSVSALWVVPEPATNHVLFAVADPAGAITEFDEGNNKQSLSIGGTDLAVSLVSQAAETNGALRVIAQVQNIGAPSATNSLLAIRRAGQTNAPLATVVVPLLEPGRLAQVALDLPAGTQPAGEALYTLRADETLVTSDVDTNNNTTTFAVNLWIDSDGDGIPDAWMMEYFGHATGQAADKSRAQDDFDDDGVSNLAEYLAGTAPNDPLSYLRLNSITMGGTNGVEVAWGSATNKLYTLQRTPTLLLSFTNLVEHLFSTPPENVYLDTSATNANSFFYRVKVE